MNINWTPRSAEAAQTLSEISAITEHQVGVVIYLANQGELNLRPNSYVEGLEKALSAIRKQIPIENKNIKLSIIDSIAKKALK